MSSYWTITRGNRIDGQEGLYVADETNEVQWFRLADVDQFGTDEPFEPYMATCDECAVPHRWRRVQVIV